MTWIVYNCENCGCGTGPPGPCRQCPLPDVFYLYSWYTLQTGQFAAFYPTRVGMDLPHRITMTRVPGEDRWLSAIIQGELQFEIVLFPSAQLFCSNPSGNQGYCHVYVKYILNGVLEEDHSALLCPYGTEPDPDSPPVWCHSCGGNVHWMGDSRGRFLSVVQIHHYVITRTDATTVGDCCCKLAHILRPKTFSASVFGCNGAFNYSWTRTGWDTLRGISRLTGGVRWTVGLFAPDVPLDRDNLIVECTQNGYTMSYAGYSVDPRFSYSGPMTLFSCNPHLLQGSGMGSCMNGFSGQIQITASMTD